MIPGDRRKKLMAVAMVATLLAVATVGVCYTEIEEPEPVDAVFPAVFLPYLTGMIIGAIIGVGAGYVIGSISDKGSTDEYTRSMDASKVAESIGLGMTYYDNTLANYEQIWTLTDDHWIRQAELAASFTWSEDAAYNPYKILQSSGVYLNSTYMLVNATAQINEHFTSLSERMDLWNKTDPYIDMMELNYTYGSSTLSTKSNFDGHITSAISVTSETQDRAYLSGGDMWVFGGQSTITSSSGQTLTLPAGYTDLDKLSGFSADMYEFQSGRQYAGNMIGVLDAESIRVNSGLVMKCGDTVKLATYSGSKILIDGFQYNSVGIRVDPDSGTSASADITSLLKDYYSLLRTIESIMAAANTSANAVWNVFNVCGEASSFLTTLMVPNNYHNMDLSVAQKTILTVLALEQLATFYSSNAAIKTGEYKLSDKSMQLFVRGDITDSNGDKVFENAVYTPFFYFNDDRLITGKNATSQECIVAIWSEDVDALSGWDAVSNIQSAKLITLQKGSDLFIYEMEHGGQQVSSIDLDVVEIDLIEAGDISNVLTPLSDKKDLNLIQIILLVSGAALVLLGLAFRRADVVIIGCIALLVGWLAGSWLWELIT